MWKSFWVSVDLIVSSSTDLPSLLHLRKLSCLDAIAKFRKATITSVCLSVRLNGETRFSLDGFSWNFMSIFRKSVEKIQLLLKYDQKKRGGGGTLREDQYTYLVHFFLEGEMLQKKLYKSRYTYFMFNNIKSCFLWDKVQNYCPAGVVTEDTTAHAHCVLAS